MANFDAFLEKLQLKYGFEYFGIFPGIYEAIVTRNDDPEQRGRIQVKCPRAGHDRGLNVWVNSSSEMAGKNFGTHFPPELGSVVRVSFENSDPSKPHAYWGGFYGQDQLPTEFRYSSDGRPERRGIVTRMGHSLVFSDEQDAESIRLIWHKADSSDPARSDRMIAADRTQGEFCLLSFEPDGSIQIANKNGSRIDVNATDALLMMTHESGHSIAMDDDGIKAIDNKGNLISIVDGVVTVVASDTAHIVAPKVDLKAGTVFVGDQAAQSIVLGESFQTLFNAHTHATGTGPSGPPLQPMTQAQLSQNAKVRS